MAATARNLIPLMEGLKLGVSYSTINMKKSNVVLMGKRGLSGLRHCPKPFHVRRIHRLASPKWKTTIGHSHRDQVLYRHKIPHKSQFINTQRFLSTSSAYDSSEPTQPSNNKPVGEETIKKSSIKLPYPEVDWDYILKDENLEAIKNNIAIRKGVGDIDKVRSLWSKLNYPEEVETDDGGDITKFKKQLLSEAVGLPNLTHPDVRVGDESQNVTVETVGTRREFSFRPRTMSQIGEDLGMLRTDNLGLTTGAKTYYLLDGLAQLEQSLVRYTVDRLESAGFSLISVPDLIHPEVVERCGFKTTGERTQVYKLDPHKHGEVALAGTGEMPIAGMLMGQKFKREEVPQKLMTVSRCFRAETSDADEEKGIYRVHQFTKVEMFGITAQDTGSESEELLKEFTDIQQSLFSDLGLHFRILDMASQELGAPAYRKYDMEAWMPAKQFWGEISSASNCTDYQSRRLAIKYEKDETTAYTHTINGTACAVPRMIMAIVESHQNKDGTVSLPEVLHKYMDGRTVLEKNSTPFEMRNFKLTKLFKSKTKS